MTLAQKILEFGSTVLFRNGHDLIQPYAQACGRHDVFSVIQVRGNCNIRQWQKDMLLGERNRTGSLQWWRVEAGDENGRQEGIKEFTFFCFFTKERSNFLAL